MPSCAHDLNYSQNSLKVDDIGEEYGGIKGDTRSVDYGSFGVSSYRAQVSGSLFQASEPFLSPCDVHCCLIAAMLTDFAPT